MWQALTRFIRRTSNTTLPNPSPENQGWIPRSINNAGQIVGWGSDSAVLWDQGTISRLPLLPGYDTSHANAIDDAGLIVGSVMDSESDYPSFQPVLWENSSIVALGHEPADGFGSFPQAMNNAGQIVGFVGSASRGDYAVLWEQRILIELPLLVSGEGGALDVNDAGQIVGWSSTDDAGDFVDYHHAVLWEGKEAIRLSPLPGDTWSSASAINNRGQIVGTSWSDDQKRHGVLWQDGEPITLGALPGHLESEPRAINNLGHIVGCSGERPNDSHAVLWRDGELIELGMLPGDDLSAATAINDRGHIVGFSSKRALLWQDGQVIDPGELPALH